MSRLLTAGHYGLADVAPGDVIETDAIHIDEALIDAFAELSGDRFEIHMTREGAARHGFDNRVAHGLLVLSLVDGLKNKASAQFRAVASLGWDWSFRAPVLVGDTIRARISIEEARPTRNPDRGILGLSFEVTNQRGEVVQRGKNKLMVLA